MNQENRLGIGTILKGTYVVERYLASGGFANTYLVRHNNLNICYALKEFFLKDICLREKDHDTVYVAVKSNRNFFESQKRKFYKEAQRLAGISHPNIVRVTDLFEANNTAYYVMEYVEGGSLASRIPPPFTETQAADVLRQVLSALECIHSKGLLHMDLKPGNILADSDGNCVLIDFGASKQIATSDSDNSTSIIPYTPGYAPSEQISGNIANCGPWTDFYALGATIYHLLTGKRPPVPDTILNDEDEAFDFPDTVSDRMRWLVIWLMSQRRSARPKNTKEILGFLEPDEEATEVDYANVRNVHFVANTDVADEMEPAEAILPDDENEATMRMDDSWQKPTTGMDSHPYVQPVSEDKPKRRSAPWILTAVLAVIAIPLLIYLFSSGKEPKEEPVSGTESRNVQTTQTTGLNESVEEQAVDNNVEDSLTEIKVSSEQSQMATSSKPDTNTPADKRAVSNQETSKRPEMKTERQAKTKKERAENKTNDTRSTDRTKKKENKTNIRTQTQQGKTQTKPETVSQQHSAGTTNSQNTDKQSETSKREHFMRQSAIDAMFE